jgi:hypothetical protein
MTEREVPYGEIPAVDWWDCSVGLTCLCGQIGLVVDDDEPHTCSRCGRKWRLDISVMVDEEPKKP